MSDSFDSQRDAIAYRFENELQIYEKRENDVIKIMKKAFFTLLFLLPLTVLAFDFQVVVPSGQTLYFDTVAGGVSVVYPHVGDYASAWNGFDKPTGALTIPSQVSYQGINYPVVSVGPAAFYSCAGLTSVVISHGITTIGNSAFNGCIAMDSVAIPASITSIGSQSFGACSSLTSVCVYAPEPPTTASGAFYNVSLSACVLYVPCESASAYMSVAPWSGFGSIVAMPCSVTVSTAVNNTERGSVTGAGTYLHGTQVTLTATPADGFSFICWNDGDTRNPRLVEATSDITLIAMFFALIHDTIDLMPTFYQLQVLSNNDALGLGVGSATLPEGTVAEVCALPLVGGRFAGWSDGENVNPRHIIVTGDQTITALFDRVGVTAPEAQKWSVFSEGMNLTVTCPEGQNVTVYDIRGCIVTSARASSSPLSFVLPSAGVYVVSVGGAGARKVVVE